MCVRERERKSESNRQIDREKGRERKRGGERGGERGRGRERGRERESTNNYLYTVISVYTSLLLTKPLCGYLNLPVYAVLSA